VAVAEHRFRVMASEATVLVAGAPATDASEQLLRHLEQVWSRFIPDSDVSVLNRTPGVPVRVDPATVTLVETMVEARRLTEGAFDPTLLRPLLDLGYVGSIDDPAKRTSLPAGPMSPTASIRPSLDDLVVDRERCLVLLPPGLAIDPGGIGKGLAADLAVRSLLDAGATAALVSIGGDLSAAGEIPGGWNIEVERPDAVDPTLDTAVVCVLSIDRGGVATSSTLSRRWMHHGHEVHHLVDPLDRGQSRTDLHAVTVAAGTGWLAEAHATAALLAGSGAVLDHFRRNELSGLAFTSDGRVVASDDLVGCAA